MYIEVSNNYHCEVDKDIINKYLHFEYIKVNNRFNLLNSVNPTFENLVIAYMLDIDLKHFHLLFNPDLSIQDQIKYIFSNLTHVSSSTAKKYFFIISWMNVNYPMLRYNIFKEFSNTIVGYSNSYLLDTHQYLLDGRIHFDKEISLYIKSNIKTTKRYKVLNNIVSYICELFNWRFL